MNYPAFLVGKNCVKMNTQEENLVNTKLNYYYERISPHAMIFEEKKNILPNDNKYQKYEKNLEL